MGGAQHRKFLSGSVGEAPPIGPPITWVGSPNYTPGRGGAAPLAVVVHTTGGSLAGTDGWFANPAAQVSAHFCAGLAGELHQYVRLEDTAWSNGILEPGNAWPGPPGINPNRATVSIETEDRGSGSQAVTDAQYAATLAAARLALARYPSIRFLATHRSISPLSRPVCPGPRWIGSGRFQALAAALGLSALI